MNRIELREKIYGTFEEILDENNNLVRIAQELMGEMDRTGILSANSEPYKQALAVLFPEAYSRFLGIKILCEDGLGRSALIVQRSLMNLFFIMYWILKKHKNSRARRYIGWVWKMKYEKLKENPDAYPRESQNDIRKSYSRVRRYYRYKNKAGKIKKSNHWYEPLTIRDMAREAGLEDWYEEGYKPLSWVEHVAPTVVLSRVRANTIRHDPCFDAKILKEALITNCLCFSQILKTMDSTFSLGRRNRILRSISKIKTFKNYRQE